MSFTVQRDVHEDRERIQKGIAGYYMETPPNDREALYRDHQVADLLKRSQVQAKRLKPFYRDGDTTRKASLEKLKTGDVNATFLEKIQASREHFRKYPGAAQSTGRRNYGPDRDPQIEQIHRQRFYGMFSGEERVGRFIDLHHHHDLYVNLPGVAGGRIPSYFQYLDNFDNFKATPHAMSVKQKLSDDYYKYIIGVSDYMEDFARRTDPLEDIDKVLEQYDAEFDQDWADEKVEGWQTKKAGDEADSTEADTNIWCGDCGKGFGNQNIFNAHLQGKKHIRAAKAREESGAEPIKPGTVTTKQVAADLRPRAVAHREQRTRKLAEKMSTKRHDTKAHVESYAGMTYREREAERLAFFEELDTPLNAGKDDDEEEKEGKIYNPLNLPMNWDGKPIPYWLYKLHGLGTEYPCQICGGFVYHGRRAFEKHFAESRHVWGLRCLGITPSATFREVSTIEEAKRLHAKLTEDKEREETENKDVEQMEDSYGNVMPRKVYNDLLAAGLL